MSVHTIPGWFKVPKNKDSVLTCDIRTFKIIGTFRFHKGFFIVEKVSSEYYYTLKNNSVFWHWWFHEESSKSIEMFHYTKGYL